jgi:hypothetical protein
LRLSLSWRRVEQLPGEGGTQVRAAAIAAAFRTTDDEE